MYQLGLLSKTPQEDIGRLLAFTAACGFFGMSFAIPLRRWYILKQRLVFPSTPSHSLSLSSSIESDKSMFPSFTKPALTCPLTQLLPQLLSPSDLFTLERLELKPLDSNLECSATLFWAPSFSESLHNMLPVFSLTGILSGELFPFPHVGAVC